jgi:putative ABC transport system substrate-binding protein
MGRTIGGTLFSLGADSATVGPVAAQYIDKIFKGAQPAELPVDEISRVELVVNLKRRGSSALTFRDRSCRAPTR